MRYPTTGYTQTGYISDTSLNATGGVISYSGGYKIHTFYEGVTNFNVTSGSGNVEVLVVAGGGSGGNSNTTNANGGGGGGGVIYNAAYAVTSQNYPVTVGYGGAAIPNATVGRGNNGQNSVFGTLTALGGGGGGSTAVGAGLSGGSGGGATNNYGGGSASQPGGFANAGGATGITWTGGGGGGAGSAGVAGGNGATGGNGGTGYASSISGTTKYYAGGGGGGGNSSERAGDGFDGGGRGEGTTSYYNYNVYTNEVNSTTRGSGIPTAVPNTGGGGGGGSYWAANGGWGSGSGAGASGIVIVRYPTASISTIKTEGSYALKGVAKATTSLNRTLTRTITSPYNFANTTTEITFDIRASRTGSNIKVGLHDTGGTTTEITPNITTVDTFQAVSIDLTGVANVNKDAIDQIIITVVNADADNIFYIDNMKSVIPSSITDTVTITKSPIDLSTIPSINFWVRSDTTGSFAQFQFGESDSSEQSIPITINSANTWEQKLWDISAITGSARNAVTKFAFQFTAEAGGAVFYFDYLTGGPPNTPTLDLPTNIATNRSIISQLKTTATDDGENYLQYKIELCTDAGMTLNCQTFDQTNSQTGWSGMNTQGNTAYTSGTQATYTIQTPLDTSSTYYWRSYTIDPGGSNTWSGTQGSPYSFTTTTTPTAPTTPYTEGAGNPARIFDTTPEFSAIHNDPNGDGANYYEIEVNTNNAFTGTVMWDSGTISMSTIANGARSADISYMGSALSFNSTTYYWRIRFTDINGALGPWSATQSFTMDQLPNIPTLDSPVSGTIDVPVRAVLKTTTTDNNGDYLKYKIRICTDSLLTIGCQTYDQTNSQTGWSGQNTQSNTAYTSGTQATYTVQSALSVGTDYYWKSYAIDPGASNTWSSTQTTPYVFSTTPIVVPSAPTTMLTNGSTNPTGVLTSTTPYFSAIHNDIDNQSASYYQIIVSSQPDVNGAIFWDSGQTVMSTTANGTRTSNITYAGIPLSLNGQTLYWKIRFWDTGANIGTWSAPTSFALFNLAPPSSCMAVKDNTNTQITIRWLDQTSSEDGYYIEKKTDGGSFTNLVTKSTGSTSHIDTSVPSGHSYQYRVRSKMGSDYSDWCTTATLNFTGNFMLNGLKLNGIQLY